MAGKWVSSGSLANVWVIPVPGAALDADTLAWVAAVVANGGSVSAARQIIVNDLIVGLKADGIWIKLDRLWLFAAEDQPSALTDLVARDLATAVNSPSFSADDGYTGDGSSSYIDTNYNLSTDATNYTQDDASLFAWSNTDSINAASIIATLDVGDTRRNRIYPNYGDIGIFWVVNDSATDAAAPILGAGISAGFFLAVRTTSNAMRLDHNGSQIDTEAVASASLPNENIAVLYDGIAYGNRQISCAGTGGSLDATESTAIYNRLRTYMTAVGVP